MEVSGVSTAYVFGVLGAVFVLNSWHQEVCIRCSYNLQVGLAILVDIAGDVHRSSGQEPICE